jgi:hypothetical protein
MPVVQCPQCQKSLNLKQMPAGGRIKCPGCSNVISLGGASPAAKPAARSSQQGPLLPGDLGFDFNQIQFPSAGPVAVTTYPNDPYSRTAYQGPIPGDPLGEYIGERPAEPDPNASGQGKGKPKGTLSPVALAGIIGGVFALLLVVIVIGTVLSSGGGEEAKVSGSPASTAETVASVKSAVPAGYELVEIAGAVIYLPKGEEVSTKLSTVMEYRAVRSSTTQSNYFFGSMPETAAEIEPEMFRKRVAAQLKGGFLGGTPFERKGYKGIKGRLDQSLFVADLQIEAFHVDGRIFIVGVGPASMGASVETQMQIDRAAEDKELTTFQDSFTVGPRPKGGLFW